MQSIILAGKTGIGKRSHDNINGTFLLEVFVDMDCCENDFIVIDGLFDEEKLIYGNEEDIAEIYNYARDGLNSLSDYLETPNDGTVPKGHIESLLRSFYPMFNFDHFIENIVPESVGLGDGEISFQCSDNFDNAIICGTYAVFWMYDRLDKLEFFQETENLYMMEVPC